MDGNRKDDEGCVGASEENETSDKQSRVEVGSDEFYSSTTNLPLSEMDRSDRSTSGAEGSAGEPSSEDNPSSFQVGSVSDGFPLNHGHEGYGEDTNENRATRVFCYQTKREEDENEGFFPQQSEQKQSTTAEENCCCVECGVTFANIDLLLKHVQEHEAEQYGSDDIYQGADDMEVAEDSSPGANPSQTPSPARNMGNVSCMECGDVFDNVDTLVRHVEVHETLMRQRQSSQMSGDHECQVCHQSFINDRLLQEHVKRHNSRGGMTSSGGQSLSGPKADFNVHSYVRRPPAQKGNAAGCRTAHLCLICGDVFRQLSSLDKHYQTHNTNLQVLDHKCSLCGKVFSKLNNLHIHMRLHNQDRPYACTQCGKRFTQSSHLRQHELIHTQVRPFSCRFCPKTFRQSSHLHMHERIHTGMRPYKCHLCDKAFMQSSHLRIHERTHSRVRPYNCRFCNATFIQSAHMRLHEKRHLNEANAGNTEPSTQNGSTPASPQIAN